MGWKSDAVNNILWLTQIEPCGINWDLNYLGAPGQQIDCLDRLEFRNCLIGVEIGTSYVTNDTILDHNRYL